MVTCEFCGGTDFEERGHEFFCTECQTQTQEIGRHVDGEGEEEEQQETQVRKSKTKRVRASKPKNEERITSWECYNYILLGLTNELIELGADESLRTTVEVLWFKYLKQIEVVRENKLPPKLPAINCKRDGEIIYGRSVLKRRRRSRIRSLEYKSDVSSIDDSNLRSERKKSRTELAVAQRDDDLGATQDIDTSLANESLTSLKANDAGKKCPEKYIQYNQSAQKELKKQMKRKHFKKHCQDVNGDMQCHKKIPRRRVPLGYYFGPTLIARAKLYAIIHIALLINKDKFQLGDILRFIREGHLTYQNVDHFFPEELVERKLIDRSFIAGNVFLTHGTVRTHAANIAKLLNVTKYIPLQNIPDLCIRYCNELNLPEDICKITLNIISRALPRLQISSNVKIIPNYEARAISFIILVLKCLFGLDEGTEYECSKLATSINEYVNFSSFQAMFNFEDWLKHIEYRKLILAEYHFPTAFDKDCANRSKDFVNFLNDYNDTRNVTKELSGEMKIFEKLLNKIKNTFDPLEGSNKFYPSLTPYKDYLNTILSTNYEENNLVWNLMQLDYSKMSVEFLLFTELFIKSIFPNRTFVYKNGGKNDDIQFMHLFDYVLERNRTEKRNKKLFNVTLLQDDAKRTFFNHEKDPLLKIKPDSKQLIQDFDSKNANEFRKYSKKREKIFGKAIIDLSVKPCLDETPRKHVIYEPTGRFCVNVQDVANYPVKNFEELFKKFPISFRTILKECARIIEQPVQELYEEYVNVETYLTYVMNIKDNKLYGEKIVNLVLKKNIQKARKVW